MSLAYLAAVVWFALAPLMWIVHPSDIIWLIASLVWAIVFFGVFMWGLAKKAEAEDRVPTSAVVSQIDASNA